MLKVSSNVKANIEEEVEENNLNDFKGLYYNDNHEQKYYEGGAHFSYKDLCHRLERVVLHLAPERKAKTMYGDEDRGCAMNSTIRRTEESNTSYAKTKANSRKFASDNSRETLLERNSSSKLSKIGKTIKSGVSATSASGKNINTSNNYTNNHAQSRNNSISINKSINSGLNITNNNLDGVSNSRPMINIMKTYSCMQHNKSNSMTINSNLSNQGNGSGNISNNFSNITNYTNLNPNGVNYKKVQPKIIKNPDNHNSSLIQTKFPSNYIEILNKRKHEYSRNYNNNLSKDLMRVGNNTKNNITSLNNNLNVNSNATRSKLLNSSGLKDLNSSTDNKHYNNASAVKITQSKSNSKPVNNYKNNHNTFNLKNININMNISNSHSRNYNKNEISTLSDLTSSINRGNSKEETRRKATNVIVKPKINISFVNNINNLMASLESANHTVNFNNSQNYIDSKVVNSINNNSQNKKSRNGKVDSFLKNNKSSNSNNNTASGIANTNNIMSAAKNMKLHNFKTMLGNVGQSNSKSKSRNIKTQYSINFDTLSRGGNTFEKERKEAKDHSGSRTRDNQSQLSQKKIPRNTVDNLYMRTFSTKKPSPAIKKISPIMNKSNNAGYHVNPNATFNRDKDLSVLTSNYLFLKQKINNLKIGLAKQSNYGGILTGTKHSSANSQVNSNPKQTKFLSSSGGNNQNIINKPSINTNLRPKFK